MVQLLWRGRCDVLPCLTYNPIMSCMQVVDAGAVPLLVLCVQEPELSLKRIAASSLSDIAKHTPELAQAVVDAGAVAYLAPLVINQDAKLKRQVCCALSQIAKHSVDLAEVVVGAEIFPKILTCLKVGLVCMTVETGGRFARCMSGAWRLPIKKRSRVRAHHTL